MEYPQAHHTYGYANVYMPDDVPSDQATAYGLQDVFYNNVHLKVPVAHERSTTADSACSITSRTPSLKRRSCDHEREHEVPELQRAGSKRAKRPVAGSRAERTDHGYFCTHPDCDRKFDRLCEAKKHFKAKHTPLQLKPHGCTIDGCDFRGMWPKDIRRHLKQKHGVVSPTAIVVNTLVEPAAATNVSYEGTLAKSPLEITAIEEEPSKAPTMATLAQAISMFKRLRTRSQSVDDSAKKFIMVTTDEKSFRDVDVTGADTPESLAQRIKNTLDLHDFEMSNATLHRWNRARGIGHHLTRQALLGLVSKTADAEGTLRLFLKPPQAVLPPAHADPYSAFR